MTILINRKCLGQAFTAIYMSLILKWMKIDFENLTKNIIDDVIVKYSCGLSFPNNQNIYEVTEGSFTGWAQKNGSP